MKTSETYLVAAVCFILLVVIATTLAEIAHELVHIRASLDYLAYIEHLKSPKPSKHDDTNI